MQMRPTTPRGRGRPGGLGLGFGLDTDEEETSLEEQLIDEDPQSFPDLFGALAGATAEQSPDEQTFTGFEDRVNKEIDKLL